MLDPAAVVATEQKKQKTEHLCLNHLWCLPDDPALSAFSYSCQVSAENWISQRNSLFLLEAGILKCFLPLCISLRTPFHQVLGRHGGLLVSIAVFKTHPEEYQPHRESELKASDVRRTAGWPQRNLLHVFKSQAEQLFLPQTLFCWTMQSRISNPVAAFITANLHSLQGAQLCHCQLYSGWMRLCVITGCLERVGVLKVFSQHQRLSVKRWLSCFRLDWELQLCKRHEWWTAASTLSASPVSTLSFFFPQTVIVVRGESILNLKNSTDWFYSFVGF